MFLTKMFAKFIQTGKYKERLAENNVSTTMSPIASLPGKNPVFSVREIKF